MRRLRRLIAISRHSLVSYHNYSDISDFEICFVGIVGSAFMNEIQIVAAMTSYISYLESLDLGSVLITK